MGGNMPQNFVIRFASILFFILILAAIVIHFSTSGEATIVFWICLVPVILAIPILTSVVFAKDEELGLPTNK